MADERYVVERELARGARSVVLLAEDTVLGRPVALKTLTTEGRLDPVARRSLAHEGDLLAAIRSPHVLELLDRGERDGVPYLVMPYAAGGDLGGWLARRGPPSAEVVAGLGAQIAQALADALRAGVVHGDVKPTNVLLADAGGSPPHAYLGDFGVARLSGEATVPVAAGSLPYLAPEVLAGGAPTAASDLYALGCLLHECMTGAPPHTGTPEQVALAHAGAARPHLPGHGRSTRALEGVLDRLTAKDPAARGSGPAEAADLLRAVARSSAPQRVGARRRRILLPAAALLVIVALVAGLVAWRTHRDHGPVTAGARPGPVTGDIDGDGHGDLREYLVTAEHPVTDYQEMLTWRSDGRRLGGVRRAASDVAGSPSLGDVDGDAKLDLLQTTTTRSGNQLRPTVRVHRHRGGSWRRAFPSFAVGGGLETFSADVDGDGRDSVGIAGTIGGRFSIVIARSGADGLGTPAVWWSTTPPRSESLGVVVADLDGDGRDEIVVVHRPTTGNGGELEVLEPRDGRLAVVAERSADLGSAAAAHASPVLAGDIDGDGRDEVIQLTGVGTQEITAEVDVWRGSGTTGRSLGRSLGRPAVRSLPGTLPGGSILPLDTVLTDVDGDGRDDLAVVTYQIGAQLVPTVTVFRSAASGYTRLQRLRYGCDRCRPIMFGRPLRNLSTPP